MGDGGRVDGVGDINAGWRGVAVVEFDNELLIGLGPDVGLPRVIVVGDDRYVVGSRREVYRERPRSVVRAVVEKSNAVELHSELAACRFRACSIWSDKRCCRDT